MKVIFFLMWRHNFQVVWKTTDKWQAVCLSGGWQEVNRHIFKMSSLNRSVWLGNVDQEVKYSNWKMTNFPTFPKHGGHHRGTGCGPRCGTQLRFDCRGSGQWGCSSQAVSPSIRTSVVCTSQKLITATVRLAFFPRSPFVPHIHFFFCRTRFVSFPSVWLMIFVCVNAR